MSRIQILPALILSVCTAAPAVFSQEPGYGELRSTETTVVTRTDRHRVFELDTSRLDADMRELQGLIDQAFGVWAKIVDKSERTYYEGNGLRYTIFHFWDDTRFAEARVQAAELQHVMSRAQGKVQRINSFFVSSAAHQPETYTRLLQRHADVLNLVTQFNTLVDWGTIRSLDYDTLAWGDEREVWILNPDDYALAGIPPHPKIVVNDGAVVRTREAQRAAVGGVVEDRVTIATSRTTFLQALDPAEVRPWVDSARTFADRATAARTALIGKTVETSAGNVDFSKKRLLVQNQDDFDAMKREAVKFAEAMARMKGKRNGALSLLSGSDLLRADPNLRADWDEVQRRYEELANWGDTYYVQFDRPWDKIERNHTIFQQEEFAGRHLFEPEPEPELEAAPAVAVVPVGKLDYNAAYSTIESRRTSDRFQITKTLIPQIHALTLAQLNALANLNKESLEDDIINFGLPYVVR